MMFKKKKHNQELIKNTIFLSKKIKMSDNELVPRFSLVMIMNYKLQI